MSRRLSAPAQATIGIVVINLALVLGYLLVVRPWLGSREAADWTATTCRIVRSEVISTIERDRRNRRLTMYELVLAYDYRAGDRTQHGEAIDFEARGRTTEAGDVHALQRRFPAGSDVPCWFDPAAPGHAVLDRGSWWPGGAGVVPFAMLAIGALIAGHGIVRRRRASAT